MGLIRNGDVTRTGVGGMGLTTGPGAEGSANEELEGVPDRLTDGSAGLRG